MVQVKTVISMKLTRIKMYSWDASSCQISLKMYAKAFVLVAVFQVIYHSDYVCKSPLMQALCNDLLSIKSMIRVFFNFCDWFFCSTPSLCEWTNFKKSSHFVFRSLSFEWGLLSSAIVSTIIARMAKEIEFQSKSH